MEREKQLSILYQKQGRATQFANKAARDKWLQREIDDLERVLSSNISQVIKKLVEVAIAPYHFVFSTRFHCFTCAIWGTIIHILI